MALFWLSIQQRLNVDFTFFPSRKPPSDLLCFVKCRSHTASELHSPIQNDVKTYWQSAIGKVRCILRGIHHQGRLQLGRIHQQLGRLNPFLYAAVLFHVKSRLNCANKRRYSTSVKSLPFLPPSLVIQTRLISARDTVRYNFTVPQICVNIPTITPSKN